MRPLLSLSLLLAACAPPPPATPAPARTRPESGPTSAVGAIDPGTPRPGSPSPTPTAPVSSPDATLQRGGAPVAVPPTTVEALRAWLSSSLAADPPRTRRRITEEDWNAIQATGDWLLLELEPGAGPWGQSDRALLPLSPHPWAGWLLLAEGGATRSPFVVGAPPLELPGG